MEKFIDTVCSIFDKYHKNGDVEILPLECVEEILDYTLTLPEKFNRFYDISTIDCVQDNVGICSISIWTGKIIDNLLIFHYYLR